MNLLKELNDIQREAVTADSKNILILAGAGTGKTRVITARIIHLIKNLKISPYNILAVTFTNKAANEMATRVQVNLEKNNSPMIKTFHSFGAFILRYNFHLLGRNKYFQIYDTDDSKKALKEILKNNNNTELKFQQIYSAVKAYKQKGESSDYQIDNNSPFKKIYSQYNEYLKESNSFDFEDLILQPVKIFNNYPEVLKFYQHRFKYVLVDEYQDTNKIQFELLKLLSGKNTNIMVVGDEDQSIYKFRGADIKNILNFEKDFESPLIIRLEENYRSTNNILNIANNIIENNKNRLGKTLFSNKQDGNKITLFNAADEIEEVKNILTYIDNNRLKLEETAVLYRTNNQSRPFEQIFNKRKISYKIIGSIRFFEREEIKDAVSVLRWIINPKDKIALDRFINKPARGLGGKAVNTFFEYAKNYENLFDALQNINNIKHINKKAINSLLKIQKIFENKDEILEFETFDKILINYLKELGLWEYYEKHDEKNDTDKINNLKEFIKLMENKKRGKEELLKFLEESSLSDYSENLDDNNKLKILTIHNAKGLEFKNVFLTGLEKNLFPHQNSMDDEDEIEEERRLFYVALTRAKENLFLSFCKKRNIFGRTIFCEPSQFIYELPKSLIELKLKNKNDKTDNINYDTGDIVKHKKYGKGKIIKIEVRKGKHIGLIDFWDYSYMELILEFTPLEKIE